MRFVKNRDATDWKKNDALGRDSGPAGYQSVTEFVQDHTRENYSHQSQGACGGSHVLGGGFGAPDEEQEEEKRQMNTDFDSEQPPGGNGPTAHGVAYQYSI